MRSARDELKARAIISSEMSEALPSDEDGAYQRDDYLYPVTQDVIESRHLHFKITKGELVNVADSKAKELKPQT